jgi:RimJ/RimL family protein N-acetyltransferase
MNYATERLRIRPLTCNDTKFIIELLNQKSFIENIADKQVKTTEDAIEYLTSGPIASYREFGFGLSCVELKESGQPIGLCGLLKRSELDHPDIGYALLDRFTGKGYAKEAASGCLLIADTELNLKTVCAVTSLNNPTSIELLVKLGFKFLKEIEFYGEPTNYYEREKVY